MVWQIIIVLLGMVALVAGVVVIWYVVGLLVLGAVSHVFPLSGRRRKKGR